MKDILTEANENGWRITIFYITNCIRLFFYTLYKKIWRCVQFIKKINILTANNNNTNEVE